MEGNPALNRVRWTHSGREIAVGDSEGQIVIYDVGEVWDSLPTILAHSSIHHIGGTLSLKQRLVFEVHKLYEPYDREVKFNFH